MSSTFLSEIQTKGSELRGPRRETFDRFLKLGMPTNKQENWKFAQTSKLRGTFEISPPLGDAQETVCALEEQIEVELQVWKNRFPEHDRLVLVDGRYRRDLSDVKLAPLSQSRQIQDLNASALSLLNLTFHPESLRIEVAADQRPIHLAFFVTKSGQATFPNFSWEVAPGKEPFELFQTLKDFSEKSSFTQVVQNFRIQNGAQVRFTRLESLGSDSIWVQNLNFELLENSNLDTTALIFGGSLNRTEISVRLLGPGARTSISGVMGGRGSEYLDQQVQVRHEVPDTTSFQFFKGAMRDQSHGLFQGRILVAKDAQKTDAHQSSRALLLSESARFTALPELEIDADDVRCSHGTAIGGMDPMALFYFRSRGLSEQEAQALLVEAYASEVLQTSPDPIKAALTQVWKNWNRS